MIKVFVIALLLISISINTFAENPGLGYKLHKTEKSPTETITIEYYISDTENDNQIWLMANNGNTQTRRLLYEYARDADVLFSQDERWIIINDYDGSNSTIVKLLKRVNEIEYRIQEKIDITDGAWRYLRQLYDIPTRLGYVGLYHEYLECVAWSSNSTAILLKMNGHTDINDYLDDWYCIYDVENNKYSLDLNVLNGNSVHIKKD